MNLRKCRSFLFVFFGAVGVMISCRALDSNLYQPFVEFAKSNLVALIILFVSLILFGVGCLLTPKAINLNETPTKPIPSRKFRIATRGLIFLIVGVIFFGYAVYDTIKKPLGLDGPFALLASLYFCIVGLKFWESRRRGWFRDLKIFGGKLFSGEFGGDGLWILIILLLWGGGLCIVLDTLPGYFKGDEATILIYGRKVCAPYPHEYNSHPWANVYHPFLSCVPRFWFHNYFHDRPYFGSRLLSVIVGMATLLLIFLFMRAYLGRLAAWVAIILFGTSHMFFIFARSGLTNLDAVFLVALSIAALMAALHSKRISMGFLAGVAAGLGFYTYYAALVIFPIICAVFLLELIRQPRRSLKNWRIWATLIAGYVVASLPNIVYNRFHPENNWHRNQVIMTTPDNIEWGFKQYNTTKISTMFLRHSWHSIGGALLWHHGNFWSDFKSSGMPIIDRDTLALFLLGLLGALFFWRRQRMLPVLFLCWLMTMLLGSFLTRDPPNAPRILTALAAGYMLSGWVLAFLVKEVSRCGGCLWKGLLFIVVILLTGNIAQRNARHYYGDFMDVNQNPVYAMAPLNLMNFLRDFPRDGYFVLFTRGAYDQFGSAYVDLFNTGFRSRVLTDGKEIPPPANDKDTAYVVNLTDFKNVDLSLRRKYPNVKYEDLLHPYLPSKMPRYRVYWIRKDAPK